MARVLLTVERPDHDGIQATQTALIVDGHNFPLAPDTVFVIQNGSTGFNLTLQTNVTKAGLALPDKVIAIGANEKWTFKNIDANIFAQADGTLWVDYSDVTDGTIEVFR